MAKKRESNFKKNGVSSELLPREQMERAASPHDLKDEAVLAILLKSLIIIQILFFAFGRDNLIKRRHSYIHMSLLYKFRHESVEQCQKKCCDMSTIHIGISHDDYLVITKLGYIKIIAVSF